MIRRFLAGQFASPSGAVGRFVVAPWLDRISAPMARLALDMLEPREGERVLDVGFGGGGLMAQLVRTGARPVGVDISQAMVRRAQRRLPGAELHCADVERLPIEPGSIDKAVSLKPLFLAGSR